MVVSDDYPYCPYCDYPHPDYLFLEVGEHNITCDGCHKDFSVFVKCEKQYLTKAVMQS